MKESVMIGMNSVSESEELSTDRFIIQIDKQASNQWRERETTRDHCRCRCEYSS